MFVNNILIFFFDLVSPKDYAKPNPYTTYMYIYANEHFENTPGRVDSGRVDPGPTWLRGQLDFRPSWPATLFQDGSWTFFIFQGFNFL